MPTRRELVERVTALMRAKGDEGRVEASICFLRAFLVGVSDEQEVEEEMLIRVSELLRVEPDELSGDLQRRNGARSSIVPPTREARVLFLGRADPIRLPMIDAIARTRLEGYAEVRSASIAPVPIERGVIKVLRQAGFPGGDHAPRSVTVDDLAWADLVVTIDGVRAEWERFIPRSIRHEHFPIDDPTARIDALGPEDDALDTLRVTLRAIERVVLRVRPPRPSRMPSAPPTAPPSIASASTSSTSSTWRFSAMPAPAAATPASVRPRSVPPPKRDP